MPQPELLKLVVEVLDAAGIEYLLTGSMASTLQGIPRSTHDFDFVVSLPETAISQLVAAFPEPDFYLDEESLREAVRTRDMANLIPADYDEKVDFWILKEEPFDQSRFARRRPVEALGMRLWVSSPEDTILAKLRWARLCGGSEKQMGDARGVYEVQGGTLDLDYLRDWAAKLGVEDLLGRIEQDAVVI